MDDLMMRGTELDPVDQRHVLSAYVHRFTGQHVPQWATHTMANGKPYPVHFADDHDWLAHTYFAVTRKGRLDNRVNECFSVPTWPHNPELRTD